MNRSLKIPIVVGVFSTLMGCCPNGCFVLTGPAFEALAHPTPLREQWSRLDKSDAERGPDWEKCGGYKDGGFSPKEELLAKERAPDEKNIFAAHDRLYRELQRCMIRNGYAFIGECYDNEISRSLPACGAP